MYIGQYCETPVYTRCLGPLNAQCHRDFVRQALNNYTQSNLLIF